MGKDAGAQPQAPNPTLISGLQTQANTTAANQSAGLARYNSVGPDQNQTWTSTPNFDQSAYDQALKAWNAGNTNPNPNGTWVPGTAASPGVNGGVDQAGSPPTSATAGHWDTSNTGATQNILPAPNMADYTTNKYTLNTQLSPAMQALHDAMQGNQTTQAGTAQAIAAQLAKNGLPGVGGSIAQLDALDPTQFNKNAADAAYGSQTSYLDPQIAQQKQALMSNLADQGFTPGTPGYDHAMTQFMNSTGQQYQAARDAANSAGINSGQTQYANKSTNINQQIAALLGGNSQKLQELGQLTSGGNGQPYIPQAGQNSTGQTATTDVSGPFNAQYQGQLNSYNSNVSSNNNTTSTLASLAAAAAMFF